MIVIKINKFYFYIFLLKAGFIRFPNEEYYIEPLKDFRPSPDKEHPHVMYKRSELYTQSGRKGTNCGTKGKTIFHKTLKKIYIFI